MTCWWMVLGLAALVGDVSGQSGVGTLGPGAGVLVPPGGGSCGTQVMNGDETYEYAYTWEYGGVAPPDYGAFAECYGGPIEVCAILLDLTQVGVQDYSWVDLYLWSDAEGVPGSVLTVVPHVLVPQVGFWPSVSRVFFELPNPICAPETYWVGYWPDWPNVNAQWFVGADLDGPTGCPMTKIAPGLGYPSGWQDVSVVWGPTSAIGIGAETLPCPPVPTKTTTWGAVKALYR